VLGKGTRRLVPSNNRTFGRAITLQYSCRLNATFGIFVDTFAREISVVYCLIKILRIDRCRDGIAQSFLTRINLRKATCPDLRLRNNSWRYVNFLLDLDDWQRFWRRQRTYWLNDSLSLYSYWLYRWLSIRGSLGRYGLSNRGRDHRW
jgi:hypothetical protein